MICKFRLAIAIAAFASVVVGAANRSDAAPVDLLNDNFNGETAGTQFDGSLNINYNSFANFNVTRGTVDLINNATGWGTNVGITGHGLFVDTDGSTNAAGRMESKTLFTLAPGTYVLSFDLAGSQRPDFALSNTITASVGSLFSQSITLPFTAPFTNQSFTFTTASTSTGRLVFDAAGGDDQGLLLDNVRLTFDPAGGGATPVPEPATFLLWGLGAIAMTGYERRRRSSQAKPTRDAVRG